MHGSKGIGYIAAREIARMGGHVIIACRNMGKADELILETINTCKSKIEKSNTYTMQGAMREILPGFAKKAVDGGATTIKAAVDPNLQSQSAIYLDVCKIKSPSSLSRVHTTKNKI
ncbi:hypothetical protein LOTGIDRAFT_162382 [Lottia gigantea]|uniref:Uncharacterized protein n=1 Tax=Lottia gigantea TaxID=225164 RepID=V4A865_LOTGI|nr:hypothetical protein LOTGIDRAFT_162382 [Lottia gigantea]ESO92902.1 hypothetical protein LOTGIDRAFT_162382 [Lottia gigantea]